MLLPEIQAKLEFLDMLEDNTNKGNNMNMKTKLITPIVGVGILLSHPTYGSEELVGRAKNFEIVIKTESDGQSSIAQLKENGNIIKSSEDLFELVSFSPSEVKKDLLDQIVLKEIQKAGGPIRYQQLVNGNISKYGKDFYNYVSPNAREAFLEKGIYLSGRNIEGESALEKRESLEQEGRTSSNGETSQKPDPTTSMEWE